MYLHHHHRQVAHPSVSIAVSTSWRHFERSCAHIHTVLRPRLWGWRSTLIVWSHVHLGRPARRRQSAGGWLMAAWRMREPWVVLWWVGSRKMSEQTKSSLCGDWGLTCSTPHFFVSDMRRIWNMYYTVLYYEDILHVKKSRLLPKGFPRKPVQNQA